MKIFPTMHKNLIWEWVLAISIVLQLLPVWQLIGLTIYRNVVYPIKIQNTYISDIKGDDFLTTVMIKDSLDYFNALGDNEIIKYEEPNSLYTRPVVIRLVDFHKMYFLLGDGTTTDSGYLGVTFASDNACTIYMNESSDPIQFRETLAHEYLHCMTYDHTEDSRDLMYKAYMGPAGEENIKAYAQELKQRLKSGRF